MDVPVGALMSSPVWNFLMFLRNGFGRYPKCELSSPLTGKQSEEGFPWNSSNLTDFRATRILFSVFAEAMDLIAKVFTEPLKEPFGSRGLKNDPDLAAIWGATFEVFWKAEKSTKAKTPLAGNKRKTPTIQQVTNALFLIAYHQPTQPEIR